MEVGKVVKTICYFNADGLVDIVRVKHGYEIVQQAVKKAFDGRDGKIDA